MNELEALITLNQLPKIGPVRIRSLIHHFGSASDVLLASEAHLREVKHCSKAVAEVLINWKRHSDTVREVSECERNGIEVVIPGSATWPLGLYENKNAPVLLYVWGNLDKSADRVPVAVIGSRKTTNYGCSVTHQLATQLAHAGHTIISGFAVGIDPAAHEAALRAGERTIAVLGSGLASLYPHQNRGLAEEISQQGAVVSEYPLFTHPDKQTFPQRNRIVAAWAHATLVTEMPERSGAMITAQFAREMGRPVFAVPGPIDRPSSGGCNLLIQQGAELVTSAQQISQALNYTAEQLDLFSEEVEASHADIALARTLDKTEQVVMELINGHEQTLEELQQTSKIGTEELSVALFNLELSGMIKQHNGVSFTSL